MSLNERFRFFNKINFINFLNFKVDDLFIGYIHKNIAKVLGSYFKDNFSVNKFDFTLNKINNNNFTFDTLTNFFRDVTNYSLNKGIINKITNEYFPVFLLNSDDVIFKIDRAVLNIFGIQSRGVHLNGYVFKNNNIYIWIAKRSNTKLTFPGKLDNIVAGGISYGYNSLETLIKESWEEASINKDLINQASLENTLHYLYPYKNGIRNDIVYIYNLELPLDFIPIKNDGEVYKFFLMNHNEILDLLKNTNDFKFNSAITIIVFLLEKNLINKQNTDEITISTIKNHIYNMKLK